MATPTLDFDRPPADPIAVFDLWLADATARAGVRNPNAMALATADDYGKSSLRMVLLKELDERGAVFFTNRHSRKGSDLARNNRAVLLFHWDNLERQIRIDGSVTRTTPEEDDAYFASRLRESQISAFASPQSEPIANRSQLERLVADVEQRYEGSEIPRPPHWGGYRVALDAMEFWEGSASRLHDRILYTRDGEGWSTQRLAP
jgi:pyridoxamine 5'-phosphate oxidase